MNALNAERIWIWALLRIDRVNTQPVWTSVKFTLRQNTPLRVGPQWVMVSTSKNPGSASTSSPALRMMIELRSKDPGFVVDFPRIGSLAFTGAR
ncbi:hypothetical protein [uncultured Tessaracoccus sp.]|uniref:hypothetical protein n=1 Tax=uncultured Tessaracoccus sp. TaxID=905023 RepID=UPI002610D0D1|nr:hypothetical protein [uncultured Tessaracoccus sp.]